MKKKLFAILTIFVFVSFFVSDVANFNSIRAEAVGEPISIKRLPEKLMEGSTFYQWDFQITTVGVPDGTPITRVVYENAEEKKSFDKGTVATKNGVYVDTVGNLTKDNSYKITYEIQTPVQKKVQFSGTAGQGDTGTDYQNVTPIKAPTNALDQTYTLLAPIGSMTVAPDSIGEYLNKIFLIAIGLCAALAVIMIVIGGIQYMGDESVFGKTEGKKQITSAIGGLLIALGAFALLNTINPDLLKTNINIEPVFADIAEPPMLTESSGFTENLRTPGCTVGFKQVAVQGASMRVCGSIADNVTAMLDAAWKAGYKLSGSSWRSSADQKKERVDHCAQWDKTPPNKCTPPVAMVGTSLHENGLAIDFKCDVGSGPRLINWDNQNPKVEKTPATKACYDWLVDNAGRFQFSNLASENWHWSTGTKAGH